MRKQFGLFKQVDAYLQAFALPFIVAVVTYLIASDGLEKKLLYTYFLVGGLQLLSFFINWFWGGLNQSKFRKRYAITLLVLLISIIPPFTFLGASILLFISPVLAILYAYYNFQEYKDQAFFY
jgi:hypothetical protein